MLLSEQGFPLFITLIGIQLVFLFGFCLLFLLLFVKRDPENALLPNSRIVRLRSAHHPQQYDRLVHECGADAEEADDSAG